MSNSTPALRDFFRRKTRDGHEYVFPPGTPEHRAAIEVCKDRMLGKVPNRSDGIVIVRNVQGFDPDWQMHCRYQRRV